MAELQRQSTDIGKRPALLVIDVNWAFTSPDSPLSSNASSVLDAISQLLLAFRERKLPVFYTTVAYDAPYQASILRAKLPDLELLEAGSRWVEIDDQVAPHPGEPVIIKHLASGFFGTDLAQQLIAAGADSVYITGLTTSGCVRATAVDALQHNFRVIVPREAVGDRDPPAHEANLHDIDCKYGDVLSLAQALERLSTVGDA